MNRNSTENLIAKALAIEAEEAGNADALGFMARTMIWATLPYRKTPGCELVRNNGLLTLRIMSPSDIGLPYGSYPRLLLSWLTTEAVCTHSPVLELGPTLSGFMAELGLIPAGGRWGTIDRLRDQMRRLFSSTLSCSYNDKTRDTTAGFRITKGYTLWWDPKTPEQPPLWKSKVILSQDFFEEIIKKPVPVDMRAFKALKQSPMALDIYCWLTYRMSYLSKPTGIPWPALQLQFGTEYAQDAQGIRNFKRKFLNQLMAVLVVYPEAKVEAEDHGLLLKPSKPHVAKMPNSRKAAKLKDNSSISSFLVDVLDGGKEKPPSEPLRITTDNSPKPSITIPKEADNAIIRLSTETYEKAKKVAPGWDVYFLEQEWREWIAGKETPKNPEAAFIGFCKQRFQKKGRP